MCNIAGYAGNRPAAPILVEMLRRQQCFDGNLSCGVATIHEGKLRYIKFVGNVEEFIKKTDVLSLPGTIGIAHTRPSCRPADIAYHLAHPYISMDERTAVVSNGTTRNDKYTPMRNAAIEMLDDAGYVFKAATPDPNKNWPRLKNGLAVGTAEVRVHLVDYYMKAGHPVEEAAVLAARDMFTDNVFLTLTEHAPQQITVIRTTRPMQALVGKGETYLATTAFGFPDGAAGEKIPLPVLHSCRVTSDGFTVMPYKIDVEPVPPITPRQYKLAYDYIYNKLKQTPSMLEGLFDIDKQLLWGDEYTFHQNTRLTYEVLEQFENEGILRREIRAVPCKSGFRNRYFMWIED